MNNDVSINTFSINFSKLQDIKQNLIRKSLTQNLRRAIDLYWQTKDIAIDPELIHALVDRKISLLFARSSKIVYRCTIAFALAKYVGLSPTIVAKELIDFLAAIAFKQSEAYLKFQVVVTAGQIDFCCEDLTLACWLNSEIAKADNYKLSTIDAIALTKVDSMPNHFPIQYAHARCCSWLSLGEREKLIRLRECPFYTPIWQIVQPESLSWFDTAGNFCLTQPTEYRLLFQVLKSSEQLTNRSNLLKIAFDFSEAMLAFEAECQIFGAVKQKYPDRAIARLGLLALVQYYLQKLLQTEFGVVALREL